MAPICTDCISGSLHTGTPKGHTELVHGIQTYVTKPSDGTPPKALIILISDAFGWSIPNSRLLADGYAEKGGFMVYVPDFMNGNAMAPQTMARMQTIKSPQSWFTTLFLKPIWILQTIFLTLHWFFFTRTSISKARIFNFITSIRTAAAPFPTTSLKIGVAGFCWGGRHAFLLAADPPSSRVQGYGNPSGKIESLIDCAFTAHPSMLVLPKEVEEVRIPMSVCVGEEDMMMTREQVQDMKVILEKKGENEVVTIRGAKHGFAVRVDEKDEFMRECAEIAERQAVEWFRRWLL